LRFGEVFFARLRALNFAFGETRLLLAARFLPLFLFFFFISHSVMGPPDFEGIGFLLSGRASLHSTLFFQINKLHGPRVRAEIHGGNGDR